MIRFAGAYFYPTEEYVLPGSELPQIKREADASLGFAAGYEYRISDLLGLDLNASWSKSDVDLVFIGLDTLDDYGDITMIPITLALNFHLVRREGIDLYLSPIIGYVLYYVLYDLLHFSLADSANSSLHFLKLLLHISHPLHQSQCHFHSG